MRRSAWHTTSRERRPKGLPHLRRGEGATFKTGRDARGEGGESDMQLRERRSSGRRLKNQEKMIVRAERRRDGTERLLALTKEGGSKIALAAERWGGDLLS